MIMPDSIDSVGSNLFSDCPNLQRVHLSNSVTHLYEQSFFYCTSLSDVDFGTGIMVIDERAFYNCSSLHSVVFPASLDSIKEGCFWACTIDTVTLLSTTPPVTQGSVFPSYGGQNYAIPVYIPCGTMTAYQAAPTWSSFTNKIERSGYDLILQVNDAEMGRAEVQVEPTCAKAELRSTIYTYLSTPLSSLTPFPKYPIPSGALCSLFRTTSQWVLSQAEVPIPTVAL